MANDKKPVGSPDQGMAPGLPGGGRTGRSDLGDAESRVRRLFNLEGLVPLDWQGGIVPVVVLGDGTWPGFGTARMRRFFWNIGLAVVNPHVWVKATSDVIITRISVITQANAVPVVAFLGSDDPDPVTIATNGFRFVDRSRTSGEFAPLQQSAPGGVAGGAIIWGDIAFGIAGIAGGQYEGITTPFLLAENAKLRFSSTGGQATFAIAGMSF